MPSENNILVTQLSRTYGAKRAVDAISFAVKPGEILGFLGPNGAGKSTTLQMLSGILSPSEGQISICGVDLLTQPQQAKAHLGFLPEIPPLYPEFTVDTYLRFCARIHAVPTANVEHALIQAKQKCGLSDVGYRLIANLSKGFQQRIGIAQAIIHEPDIVILDEPTVGLDPIQIRDIRQLIKQIGSEQSVILSSHILPEIQTTCDRVQIINHGRVVFSDTVEHLQQYMEAPSLIIALRTAPDVDTLERLESVSRVEKLDNDRFIIRHDASIDIAQMIVKTSVSQAWGLYHIATEQRSLEDIFVAITTSETTVPEDSDSDTQAAKQEAVQ